MAQGSVWINNRKLAGLSPVVLCDVLIILSFSVLRHCLHLLLLVWVHFLPPIAAEHAWNSIIKSTQIEAAQTYKMTVAESIWYCSGAVFAMHLMHKNYLLNSTYLDGIHSETNRSWRRVHKRTHGILPCISSAPSNNYRTLIRNISRFCIKD